MIYGKMWTVVKPSVGVPIFLGAVAVGSFCVHLAIVSNTTWVRGFLNGSGGGFRKVRGPFRSWTLSAYMRAVWVSIHTAG